MTPLDILHHDGVSNAKLIKEVLDTLHVVSVDEDVGSLAGCWLSPEVNLTLQHGGPQLPSGGDVQVCGPQDLVAVIGLVADGQADQQGPDQEPHVGPVLSESEPFN